MVAPRRTTYAASLALNAALAAVMLYVTFSSQSSGNQEDLGIALSQSSLTRDGERKTNKNERRGVDGFGMDIGERFACSKIPIFRDQQPTYQPSLSLLPFG